MSPDEPEADEVEIVAPGEEQQPNAASPTQARESARKADRRAREDAAVLTEMLRTENGRRYMWDMLDKMHPFVVKPAMSPTGFPDPMMTMFYQGEQQMGLRLWASWQLLDPVGVALMQSENDSRLKKPQRKTR